MKKFDPINTELLNGINLIEASAGTGKTYTIAMLVLRFVVERELDIKQILVVTFTKAATEELKDRIRMRLVEARQSIINGNLSELTDQNISSWLANINLEPELVLQRLNNALLDIDQASIFTIHGFCQRMLLDHALESGQLFDSELTGDIRSIKQACSDDFWRKNIYLRSAWEASLLTANYKTPDQLLNSVDYISADYFVIPEYEELDLKLAELKQLITHYKETIVFLLQQIKKALTEEKFKASFKDHFQDSVQKIIGWLNEDCISTVDFSFLTTPGLVAGLNGNKFRKSKTNPAPSEEQKQQYIESLDINLQPFEEIDLAIRHIERVFRRSLLQNLHQEMSERLQQLNILSFDDLISRLADALKEDSGVALQQEIQHQYRAALIDEFQDTDQSQWLIFSKLFNSAEHSLYLIGDPKQAIYKFRGADIYSYFSAKAQADYAFSLRFNWRSQPQLVQAVNSLFARENPFFSENLEFNAVSPALTDENGVVENGRSSAPLVLCQLDKNEKQGWTAGKAASEIKTAVVSEIINLLKGDFCIQSQEKKKLQPKDIAILVRTNPQAMDFQFALNEVGITAVINSKESVFASNEALDLYQLLQAIAQPADTNLFKQALALDWFGLDGLHLLTIFNDEFAMDEWSAKFQHYLQVWEQKSLMVMMQSLLTKEQVLPCLSENKYAERRMTNLQHCLELIQQAVIDEHLGINKTLNWLRHHIELSASSSMTVDEQQLRLESDEDAIKIMTMHGSKGLEYPVVFCPFLWQRSGRLQKEQATIKCHDQNHLIADLGSEHFEHHRRLALQEELAEDLRVFYVAVTRAQYRCYIYWADVRTIVKANESAMAYLLDFSADNFEQQQQKLHALAFQQPESFEYRLLSSEQIINDAYQTDKSNIPLINLQRQRSLFSHWQMSSYTALSALSVDDTPELPDDKVREDISDFSVEKNALDLPRGTHTGNVIHYLLENIPFHYLAENNNISEQRNRACLRYGLSVEKPECIDELLKQTVNTTLSDKNGRFTLSQLDEKKCLKEMPFYLTLQTTDVSNINHLLKECPVFQPLSKKILSGYLTGFIDLICENKGKYYVMDYKSTMLESYDQDAVTQAMREHNYGLQYWIYTVVLHLYLQKRLVKYSFQQHFGGVKYLFVRGMDANKENSGVYQVTPDLFVVNQLLNLFQPK